MLSRYFSNPEAHFMPDQKALKAWLATNKNTMNNAGVIRPGLFNEPSINASLGFLLVILIEVIATFWAKEEGIAIETIAGFVLVDIFLAWASHRMEGKLIQSKNELMFNTNTLKGENVKNTIQRYKNIKNIFYVMLLASGLYKGISFYLLYDTFDSTALCIILAYFIGAILHIYCTGYAFAYWHFKLLMDSQFSKFMNSEGGLYAYDKAVPRLSSIETTIALTETRTFKHAIVMKNNAYFFETKGVLLDTELSELISKQVNREQQRLIAVEGVRLQCDQLTW